MSLEIFSCVSENALEATGLRDRGVFAARVSSVDKPLNGGFAVQANDISPVAGVLVDTFFYKPSIDNLLSVVDQLGVPKGRAIDYLGCAGALIVAKIKEREPYIHGCGVPFDPVYLARVVFGAEYVDLAQEAFGIVAQVDSYISQSGIIAIGYKESGML